MGELDDLEVDGQRLRLLGWADGQHGLPDAEDAHDGSAVLGSGSALSAGPALLVP